MDTLSDLLSSMRLAGGVFLDGEMAGPWSIISQVTPEEAARYFLSAPPASHIIAYHYVREGWLECQVQGDDETVMVRAGQIVLLPRNLPHLLHGPERSEPVDGSQVVDSLDEDGLYRVRLEGTGQKTSVYCGFLASTTPENMLLRNLPAIMVVGLDDAKESDWIRRSLDFAVHGLSKDSPETVGKMAEALFAEAVKRYIDALPPEEAGWLAGLKDPAVGRTIALIHKSYAEALTLEALAREAGVSKTVLGDRFRALLGESPMQYCAKWRMNIAADMLRQERQHAANVAYSVGFNSEAAFNRAFKREFGLPPAAWQKMQMPA
ncbi:MAG TPA: AraC family transcriptional regulator [Novosphingobium sp.]